MRTFLLLGILLFLFACKKNKCDEMPAGPDDCVENYLTHSKELTYKKGLLMAKPCFEVEKVQYPNVAYGGKVPQFNPDNPYEIAFQKGWVVYKYNFCTNKTTKIMDNSIFYYGLCWGTNDWILFTSFDQNVYKIKSNGDSVTKLTTNGIFNNMAVFNPSGSKMAYLTNGSQLCIANSDGSNNQLVPEYGNSIFWTNDSTLLLLNYARIKRINIIAGISTIELARDTVMWFGNYYNSKSDCFYFTDNKGFTQDPSLFLRLNLSTNTVDTLYNLYYNAYMYTQGSYSPMHDKFVSTLTLGEWRIDSLADCVMYTNDVLIIGDGDGQNTREIILPE